MLFDKVKPEPSIDDVNAVVSEYKGKNPAALIGLGGGSSMDVVKYASAEFGVEKILIPTTFGTGAEMTTYCVLKFDGKKKLLGPEERFLADRAIVDSYFMDGTPEQIINNSVCDACAQASHTEFLTICSGVPSIKYESTMARSARNLSSGPRSFFLPSNFKTQ